MHTLSIDTHKYITDTSTCTFSRMSTVTNTHISTYMGKGIEF